MSRARHSSHVYVVADTLDQAVEDVVRDWSAERRPRWAIDTGTAALKFSPSHPRPLISSDAALRLARLRAERDAVAAAIPPDPGPPLYGVEARLADLRQAQRQLEPGWARYPDTLEGEAARALSEARHRRHEADEFARMDGMDRRSRRYWRRAAREWEGREEAAQERYDRVVSPNSSALSTRSDTSKTGERISPNNLRRVRSGCGRTPRLPAASSFSTMR